MMNKPRVGILPLYLELYKEVRPEFTETVREFAEKVAARLQQAGLEIELGDIGCVESEIERIAESLVDRGIDLLATLHLAYSPSLEAVEVLGDLKVPLVLLDTTPSPTFGPDATAEDMMANHGIHGVQDLACMLRRTTRQYDVIVGHIDNEEFVGDVVSAVKAARAKRHLNNARALVIGEEFKGMGDFRVDPAVLESVLGIEVQRVGMKSVAKAVDTITDSEVKDENSADRQRFDCSDVDEKVLSASNRVGLAVRRLVEEQGATAFSANFESFTREAGAPTVPFLEASRAMSRGIGYAGEADAMTAAFVGALLQGFVDVTFTEMFCPDWQEETVFMSHMGECNVGLAAETPRLVEKDYAFGDAENPAVPVFKLKPGPATLVNLTPGPKYCFTLIATAVEILDRGPQAGFPDVPHFWIRPVNHSLRDTLRLYSEAGGTHHSALILGNHMAASDHLAAMLGIECVQI
ncbi:MAG: hypothetical protein R6V19_14120 [Armatimonadota bacterium]